MFPYGLMINLNYTVTNQTANTSVNLAYSTTLNQSNYTWYCKVWDGLNENVSSTYNLEILSAENSLDKFNLSKQRAKCF